MNLAVQTFNICLFNSNKKILRQNINTPYKGVAADKNKILNILDEKFKKALTLNDSPIGEKNLIYTAVFGVNYSMLLDLLLKSIYINNKTPNFDILVITDILTLKIIRASDYLKKFNYDFHIIDTPNDGVEASMTKTRIYEYKNINQYGKILFLDADIICRGDITNLFKQNITNNFEAVVSPLVLRKKEINPDTKSVADTLKDVYCAATISHGLSFYTDRISNLIKEKDPKVFNAGQFLFKNNEQYRAHFENINWLISVWPSAYFYEQSFLNHYFVLYEIVSYEILDKTTIVATVTKDLRKTEIDLSIFKKQHLDTHSLIHFAGTSLDGRNKYMFINHYCNYHNICL